MNILIIGNGFDLEHGLNTSYREFLSFCDIIKSMYKIQDSKIITEKIKNCKLSDSIKGKLNDLLSKRELEIKISSNGINCVDCTINESVNELYKHIKDNVWIKYFNKCTESKEIPEIGENWIDFELEISNVIKELESYRSDLSNVEFHEILKRNTNVKNPIKRAMCILKIIYINGLCDSLEKMNNATITLNSELNRLIRALEIYISEFINTIEIENLSKDIMKLEVDHILSFNYSNTYERLFGKGKDITYDYIHGKACGNKNVKTSNLVLGIEEYLDDDLKDSQLEFITFKKLYQRIYKETDNSYLEWIDVIKDNYKEYQKKMDILEKRLSVSEFDDSVYGIYEKKDVEEELRKNECPTHNLYIFGHSLDVTDKDVLKGFICNDNVQTKIYYFREDEEDKKTLGRLIINLIKMIGQNELVRRTGGIHKTIEFIPQTIKNKPNVNGEDSE